MTGTASGLSPVAAPPSCSCCSYRCSRSARQPLHAPPPRPDPSPTPFGHPGESLMMTRRQFLARSALLGSAAWLAAGAPGRLLAAAAGKSLGIQLYMVLKAYQ